MKTYQAASLFMLLAVVPAQFTYADVSQGVQQNVQQVAVAPKDAKAIASLVTALKEEIKAQGLDKVSAIAATVIASATDAEGAKALADAIMTAAMLVGVETGNDLSLLAADVGEGLVNGTTDAALQTAAIEGATSALETTLTTEQAETVTAALDNSVTVASENEGTTGGAGDTTGTGGNNSGGSDVSGGSEIIVPDSGDAGDTPSVDISTGTGVND